jgi:hypothetical protein
METLPVQATVLVVEWTHVGISRTKHAIYPLLVMWNVNLRSQKMEVSVLLPSNMLMRTCYCDLPNRRSETSGNKHWVGMGTVRGFYVIDEGLGREGAQGIYNWLLPVRIVHEWCLLAKSSISDHFHPIITCLLDDLWNFTDQEKERKGNFGDIALCYKWKTSKMAVLPRLKKKL